MRLFAAIVPPREVLDEVRRVVQSVNEPMAAPPQGRGLLRRLSARTSTGGAHAAGRATVTAAPTVAPTTPELDAVEPADMYLPLTGFGNVTLGDSVKLASTLRSEAATWRRTELVFTGGAALEFPGDECVWVRIEGDLDGLNTIGRGVPQAVQRVGYFVDRRVFRTWLAVGSITADTTAPYLERLVAALDDFRSEPWTAEAVCLMKWLPEAENGQFEVMERMPLR